MQHRYEGLLSAPDRQRKGTKGRSRCRRKKASGPGQRPHRTRSNLAAKSPSKCLTVNTDAPAKAGEEKVSSRFPAAMQLERSVVELPLCWRKFPLAFLLQY